MHTVVSASVSNIQAIIQSMVPCQSDEGFCNQTLYAPDDETYAVSMNTTDKQASYTAVRASLFAVKVS